MIQPKNETEDLLLSITKICEALFEQTLGKPEETLELKLNKPREKLQFNPPISIEGSWMIGLANLQVYTSFFKVTEEIRNFTLYKIPDSKSGGVLYRKIRDEIKKDLEISVIIATD